MERAQRLVLPEGFKYLAGKPAQRFEGAFPHLDRNVFVMMPFSGGAAEKIHQAVESTLVDHGLVPLRAGHKAVATDLWWNVVTYILGCSYGIAVFEPTERAHLNPNVAIEAGFMMALDKPVLLLANSYVDQLPIDFAGQMHRTYDATDIPNTVARAVADWVRVDIPYYDYGDQKVVVFASLGGTCRCVMAKGILSKMLDEAKITGIKVEAAAIADPHNPTVSPSALKALAEIGADQWLAGHRPRKLSTYLQARASMIIVLSDLPLARDPGASTNVLFDRDLFGASITNPYPDLEDDGSLTRYRAARQELESAVEAKFGEILDLLDATPKV